MTSQRTLSTEFREFRPDDYERLVEIHNANYPGNEVSVSEQIARDNSMKASKFFQKRWACLDQTEKIVGFGGIRHVYDTFHPQKFMINILVDPTSAGQGIGSAIYYHIERQLNNLNAIMAWAFCKEDLPLQRAFYRKRGFMETRWEWESSLDLKTFDPSRFQNYFDKARTDGITFTTLSEELQNGGESSLKKIHELTELVMADQPTDGPFTPRTYEQWEAIELRTPRLVPEGWFFAKIGQEFVGLSNVYKNEKDPRHLSTGDTGVVREHRGRGIATALKVKAIEFAKRGGYDSLETQNDSTNAAMLAVNTKLGFKRKTGWVRMEKTLH